MKFEMQELAIIVKTDSYLDGFAREFTSFEKALAFNHTLPNECLIFERKDL